LIAALNIHDGVAALNDFMETQYEATAQYFSSTKPVPADVGKVAGRLSRTVDEEREENMLVAAINKTGT
jgi:hypothetical protein